MRMKLALLLVMGTMALTTLHLSAALAASAPNTSVAQQLSDDDDDDDAPPPPAVEKKVPVAEPTRKDADTVKERPVASAPAPVPPSPPAAPAAPDNKSLWRSVKAAVGADDDDGGTTAERLSHPPAQSGSYIIGPGDQIGITVWREENLTRTVVVLPDGKISFPLVGEVVAGGRTVAQLKKALQKKLARYIGDSAVTVEVRQSNSMIIYVVGRVNVPGRQLLLANTNVLQALAMVGGLTPFAQKDRIKIIRQEEGRTITMNFNYEDVSEGKHLETNVELKRGDVIIVP